MITCYVCGNTVNNRHYSVQEMMFGFKDEFDYFECSNCGCLQISNDPINMDKYYPASYYSFEALPEAPQNWLRRFLKKKSNRHALFNDDFVGKLINKVIYNSMGKRFSSISKVPLNFDSRILDVGCGSGILLYALKELGFKSLLGCDPFIKADIKYNNGLQVLKKTLSDIEGEWDLIMFHHSFEHIANQLETLQAVSRLLAINGVCLLSMPTVSSYAWKHYGVNWVQLDAPRHLIIHSTESISKLAEKVNLKQIDVFYNSNSFQFWGSEQYLQNIPLTSSKSYAENPENSIFSKKTLKEYERQAAKLNQQKQGDMAAFYFTHA